MAKIILIVLLLFTVSVILIFSAKNNSSKAVGQETFIPDEYIVVFKDDVQSPKDIANNLAKTHNFALKHVYSFALKGFSAKISSDQLEKVKNDPNVKFINPNAKVNVDVFQNVVKPIGKGKPPTPTPTPSPSAPTPSPQVIPTGISRIGRNLLHKGTGVVVATIDTGIQLDHPDLATNIIANKSCLSYTTSGNDDNGHGTHVAGTIAAIDNTIGVVGVAPEAKLVAVKVFDDTGSGTWAEIICGIDWVTANAATYNIKVVNMSLGGDGSSDNNCGNTNNDALHMALCKSTQIAGVTYVVSAGNNAVDVGTHVPAAYNDTVITVSALVDSDGKPGGLGLATLNGADDTFANFSNFGSVVDLGAPGVSIFSTYLKSSYATLSGTSMSAPHVSGSAVLYIQTHPTAIWTDVRNALITAGEPLNNGHTDPSGLHPEPVVLSGSL